MHILLTRHGNTFGLNDQVVWVGASSDLALVESGRRQAHAIGHALKRNGLTLSSIYTGPLKRTRETAAIVASIMSVDAENIYVADELCEIDYGCWEGLSNEDIRAEYGSEVIENWQKRSIWPNGYGWNPSEGEVLSGWSTLIARIAENRTDEAVVMLVSSNGIFKLAAKTLGISPSDSKMGTGCLSILAITSNLVALRRWNILPSELNEFDIYDKTQDC